MWACKGKSCTGVRKAGQSTVSDSSGETGLIRQQQRPVRDMGCLGLRFIQQCTCLFIYFKEETDGEECEGKTGETHSSLLGCLLLAGMVRPTPMQCIHLCVFIVPRWLHLEAPGTLVFSPRSNEPCSRVALSILHMLGFT